MKTTIDLPDELLIAAKKRAAEEQRPMRELIEQGLRHQLARRPRTKGRAAGSSRLRWVVAKGGLPPGLDLHDRAAMHEWIGRGR